MNSLDYGNEEDGGFESVLSRRDALIGIIALAMSGTLSGERSFAQESAGSARLDLHHHFWPNGARHFAPFVTLPEYSPERAIESMDLAEIRTAFLSLPVRIGDDPVKIREDAINVARETNEYGAKLVSDYPGRFGLFANLPLPDIDASLREIEYAFDTLQADGVALLTSYGNHWLGDTAFQPVFDELNRRSAVVYSHPTDGPCCHNLLPNTLPQMVEWNTDTSRAIWSMINDGTDRPPLTTPVTSMATRYAHIKFVWSHAGGSLVGMIGRFLGRAGRQNPDLSANAPLNSMLYHLRRFYYDTAGSANPIQMQALKSLVGASQIVFGSDLPFVPALENVEGLQECGFSAQELRGINRDNALRILPEWSSR